MATKDTSKIRVKDPQKYEYAYLLYMQRVPQKEIAERADVSQQTLSKWKEDGGWEMKRAARTISRDELLNKTMMRINDMLDDREGFNADAFSKAVEGLTGCVYEPIALLASQVVAGMNYCLLCRLTVVYPDAQPTYALVYVYQNSEGACELARVEDITFSIQEPVAE